MTNDTHERLTRLGLILAVPMGVYLLVADFIIAGGVGAVFAALALVVSFLPMAALARNARRTRAIARMSGED